METTTNYRIHKDEAHQGQNWKQQQQPIESFVDDDSYGSHRKEGGNRGIFLWIVRGMDPLVSFTEGAWHSCISCDTCCSKRGWIVLLFLLTAVLISAVFGERINLLLLNHGLLDFDDSLRQSLCYNTTYMTTYSDWDAENNNYDGDGDGDDDDYYTNNTSPCHGACYSEYNDILVPARGFRDGCNWCSCYSEGYLTCTLIGCFNTCRYNGWVYSAGSIVPHYSGDSCNTCRCMKFRNHSVSADDKQRAYNYEIVCTTKQCNTCIYEGAVYEHGQTFSDACRICTCSGTDGTVTCDDDDDDDGSNSCENSDDGGRKNKSYCTWQGKVFEINQCFLSDDGLNRCGCMEGGKVVCTDCDNY